MEKDKINSAIKLHMILVVPIAIINIVGIFSSTLYTNVFVFFIISLLNLVTLASIILQILKYSGKSKNRKVSLIHLAIIGVLALTTFLKYIYLLAT